MASMTFTGEFLEKIERTSDSASYFFSRPPEYVFEPGQSVCVTIPGNGGTMLEHRFSHADSPTEKHTEITTRLTGSDYKQALDSLTPDAEAAFRGPAGDFVLRPEEPKIAFLTGGIGITPVRSMLKYLYDTREQEGTPSREVVLFYGSRTEAGIVYRDQLEEMIQGLPNLRVVHVLSEPGQDWQGRRGLITADLVEEELTDPCSWLYYIDGPPPMIAAMRAVTDQLGIPKERIIRENFVGYVS